MDRSRKIFSKEVKDKHVIYRILGLKLSFKNTNFLDSMEAETAKAIKIQNSYNLKCLKSAKKLILFFVPSDSKIGGGILSIYSLCETSRSCNPEALCIISTLPNSKYTHASNNMFLNNEKIYRFSQIVNNCKNLDELIIHIPECLTKEFCNNIEPGDEVFLKSVKNLQLNILNQNIELMPEPHAIEKLYKFTNNITQTIAHNRYATQEVCDKWNIPTHLFSVHVDISKYKQYPFEEKEKIIVLSPDKNKNRDRIVKKLQEYLPDWQFITVNDMTFSQYLDLISKAFFTVTFGEGMDGYFIQPARIGSIGFAVYNDNFFPDESWKDLLNVYKNYDDMFENIINDMHNLLNNKDLYYQTVKNTVAKRDKLYGESKYKDNLKRFYNKQYDFYPKISERVLDKKHI